MNCERVKELWDDYRDGLVAGSDARGLEQHLADCPHCERLWRSESAWLSVLGEKTPLSEEDQPEVFISCVVRRWTRATRPSIIGRIARLTAAAAVVTLILSLAAVMAHRTGSSGPEIASAPRPDPSEVLLAQIDGPVVAVRQAFGNTSQLLDMDRHLNALVDLWDSAALPGRSSIIRMQ